MTVTLNAKAKLQVDIDWAEELVEDERSFYIKLSPQVSVQPVDVDVPDKEFDKIVQELQKVANNAKVKK